MAWIGMQYPVWAEMTGESNGTPVYGAGIVMGKATSGNLNWQKEDNELYGDDVVAETDQSLTGYTLDIGTTDLADEVEEKVLGTKKVGSTDEYEITDEDPPYGGCGYIRVIKRNGDRLYKALWYPKVQFAHPNESDATKQKNTNWGTPTINGKGMGVYDDASGKAKFRKQQVFATLAAAKAYLNGKANIS